MLCWYISPWIFFEQMLAVMVKTLIYFLLKCKNSADSMEKTWQFLIQCINLIFQHLIQISENLSPWESAELKFKATLIWNTSSIGTVPVLCSGKMAKQLWNCKTIWYDYSLSEYYYLYLWQTCLSFRDTIKT